MSRRRFVPEVIQTSAMDCGPAGLKCLLEGFSVPVHYARLRQACQTDVDGTSIDTIEDVAVKLGLDAEQIMLPPDHLLLPEAAALPALVVVVHPNGLTHFVVAWRCDGPWVQVMDPAVGRQWIPRKEFLSRLYVHRLPVPAADWREWAGSDEFTGPLKRRLDAAGVPASALVEKARADTGWRGLACLDAATRLITKLIEARALEAGPDAARLLETFLVRALADPSPACGISRNCWTVEEAPPGEEGSSMLFLGGAVALRVKGVQEQPPAPEALPRDLAAAVSAPAASPERVLWQTLLRDARIVPVVLTALLLAGGSVMLEAVLFRGCLDLGQRLEAPWHRVIALGALLVFLAIVLGLERNLVATLTGLGRRLEGRIRVLFLVHLGQMSDAYFRSRLTSDMAERAHATHTLRDLPLLAGRLLRALFELLFTAAGLLWLLPSGALAILALVVSSVGFPLAVAPLLAERDLRARTHAGALSRFMLDVFMGLVPVRAHAGERALQREHETLLATWARAAMSFQDLAVAAEALGQATALGLAAWVVVLALSLSDHPGRTLLVVYWALNIPTLGTQIAQVARQYPTRRNVTRRLLEPFGDHDDLPVEEPREVPRDAFRSSVHLRFEDVSIAAGGCTVLNDITLDVPAGTHVAVLGRSGAGKSTLLACLLGGHRPMAGRILVDGHVLEDAVQRSLLESTAWVDPAVHLWNRSLLDNLLYGSSEAGPAALAHSVERAELLSVVERLESGLQTPLGEGGALVSGGEGQRVRLGRGLTRGEPALVILDEPFRGLEGDRRHRLMEAAREAWRNATLLCVTHDVADALNFDRVVILDGGSIVEQGEPAALQADPSSRLSCMLRAEREVRDAVWQAPGWRRLQVVDGHLETEARTDSPTEADRKVTAP